MVSPALATASRLSAAWSRRKLARFARSRQFARLHAEVVEWVGGCFAQIEDVVPALVREAAEANDWCGWQKQETGWFPQLWPPADKAAWCSRQVTAYYRFDGYLPDLLGQIARVLRATGWEVPGAFSAAGQQPLVTALWRNGNAPPDGTPDWLLRAVKYAYPSLLVGWTGNGESLGLCESRQAAQGNPYWYSVEFTPADQAYMSRGVPEASSVTVGIQVHVTYYQNPSLKQSPLPRR